MSFHNDSQPHSIAVDVVLTDLQYFNKNNINVTDVLGEENKWTHSKYMHIQIENRIVNLTANTGNAMRKDNVNRAFLNNAINLTGTPIYLSVSYSTSSHSNNTTFTIEINDNKSHNKLWSHELRKIEASKGTEFFILPDTLTGKKVNLSLRIGNHEKGIDSLILKNLTLYS